nr:MAG TPA: hypothetical protein [Caudoviricetes sp.]
MLYSAEMLITRQPQTKQNVNYKTLIDNAVKLWLLSMSQS